jgi:hypothetical protein
MNGERSSQLRESSEVKEGKEEMKKHLFVIYVIFFCFFISACSDKAVSSWVLWKHTIVKSEYRKADQWNIEEAFPTYEQCVKERDTRIKDDRAAFERLCKDHEDMKVEDMQTGVSYSGNIGGRFLSRTHSYTCLQNAVDPRK